MLQAVYGAQVGRQSGAFRTLLTHFSQRYPKIPIMDPSFAASTCIASDLMRINLAGTSAGGMQALPMDDMEVSAAVQISNHAASRAAGTDMHARRIRGEGADHVMLLGAPGLETTVSSSGWLAGRLKLTLLLQTWKCCPSWCLF